MAANYFLKFSGVKGEVANLFHQDEIQLAGWGFRAFNFSSVASGRGSGANKVTLEDFSFISMFDKSSAQFFIRICKGMHIPNAVMTAEKAGSGVPWLEMTFKELFITGIQSDASYEIPAVNVSFSFEEVTIEYRIQDNKGLVTSTGPITYNRKENKLS